MQQLDLPHIPCLGAHTRETFEICDCLIPKVTDHFNANNEFAMVFDKLCSELVVLPEFSRKYIPSREIT